MSVRLVTPLTVEVSWREPAVPNGQIFRYTVYAVIAGSKPDRRRRQAVADLPGGIKQVLIIIVCVKCSNMHLIPDPHNQ